MSNEIVITGIEYVYCADMLPDTPSFPVNARKQHVLALLLDGEMKNSIVGNEESVVTNDVIFIPSGSIDVSVSPNGCKYIAVEFLTLHNDFSLPQHSKATKSLCDAFHTLLKLWAGESMNKKGKCFEILYGIINQIVDNMCRMSCKQVQYNKLSPAIEYINQHCLESNFCISKIAMYCNLSSVHLNRLFQSLYNTSVSKYVLHKRIEYAKILLMDSRNNISEVAHRCGWTDVYAFSHSFKRIIGASPTAWRERGEKYEN